MMDEDGPLLPDGMLLDEPVRVRVRRKRRSFKRLRKVYARVVPARVRTWIDDNPALAAIVGLLLLLLLVILLWLLWLWLHLSRVPGFDADLGDNRPPYLGGENILLVGLDCDPAAIAGEQYDNCPEDDGGKGLDLRNLDKQRPTGVRSDVLMVLHVTEDGQHAQVVSIPRDSYVAIPGHGRSKINAAFSWGGPSLLGRTIEQNFDIHLTHIAVVDFEGFRGITDALGGVQVYIPRDIVDERFNVVTWRKGWTTIKGDQALQYVRTRHGLARGDFDRVQRHQNFLRAVVEKVHSSSVLANPLRLTKLVTEITGHLALDSDFSDRDVLKLAVTGMKMHMDDMSFATIPYQGAAMVGDASVVLIDLPADRALFAAMQRDKFLAYVADHKVESLPAETQVK